jgi:putative alpha-1,2-mannosidase
MPGNADGGALPSWYVFSAIGLYPEVPGIGGFVLGSPMFKSIVIHCSGGRTITVQGVGAGASQPYVHSLSLDGQTYHSLWLPLAKLNKQRDSTLRFVSSSHPDKHWGSSPQDAPLDVMTPQEPGQSRSDGRH